MYRNVITLVLFVVYSCICYYLFFILWLLLYQLQFFKDLNGYSATRTIYEGMLIILAAIVVGLAMAMSAKKLKISKFRYVFWQGFITFLVFNVVMGFFNNFEFFHLSLF
jgi:hypothetical protein